MEEVFALREAHDRLVRFKCVHTDDTLSHRELLGDVWLEYQLFLGEHFAN
jgi:hypothetical protein